jgi:hypothetical protein
MLLGYWGSYAVKHFIETAKELVKLGWKQYIPTSDNPRDSAEVMEARMAVEFGGRIPNVLLFLQDYDIMDREKYPRKLLSETSYLCWYDDTPFSGFPPQYAAGLDDATLLLPTYEYLQQRTPSLASVPRVWMPHSALPAFESLPFNTDPREKVLLVGAVMGGYEMRVIVRDKISRGDERFEQFQHPGWQPGPGLGHIVQFATAMHGYLACILDGSANNFAVAKIFEVPAVGALLLMSDDLVDALLALGFKAGVHYLPYNRSSMDDVVDFVLDPKNRPRVDAIRAEGQALAHTRHTTRERVKAIHDAALEAFRVQGTDEPMDLATVQRFPNYEDWAYKHPNSEEYYRGTKHYRRARLLETHEQGLRLR